MNIKDLLAKEFILFDGAMGTLLLKAGLKGNQPAEEYNITRPEIIKEIHQSYVRAGADVISANTFQANELKLKHSPYSVEEIISAGVGVTKTSGARFVALDLGPLGELMEPNGKISFEEAYEIFARQIKAGVSAGADLILIETLSDLYEAKAAILAAKENSSLPVFCTMTFQKGEKTIFGTDPLTATMVLQSLGADALGVNCSLGPQELMPVVEEIVKCAKVPVMVQPNAGLPKTEGAEISYDISPENFAKYIREMAQMGVTVFGGCCGTSPEHIVKIKEVLSDLEPVKRQPPEIDCACSSRKTVICAKQGLEIEKLIDIDKGEFTEETKEQLRAGNFNGVISKARNLQKAGASILQINLEPLGSCEINIIQELIKKLQRVVNVPVMIGGSLEGIEAGVRVYNGKPLIGPVPETEGLMDNLLSLAKKYGCITVRTSDKGIEGPEYFCKV